MSLWKSIQRVLGVRMATKATEMTAVTSQNVCRTRSTSPPKNPEVTGDEIAKPPNAALEGRTYGEWRIVSMTDFRRCVRDLCMQFDADTAANRAADLYLAGIDLAAFAGAEAINARRK